MNNTEDSIKELIKELEKKEALLKQKENELKREKAAVLRERALKEAAEERFEELSNSTSMRVTRPLRAVANTIRAVVRKTKKGVESLKKYGFKVTWNRIFRSNDIYSKLLVEFRLTADERERQQHYKFDKNIKFSILVPLYNTPDKFLKDMIESVIAQTYSGWELCLADGSDDNHDYVGSICQSYSRKDSRIKYKKLIENRGISENTNAALEMAKGDYIALFDHDDLLTENALFEIAYRIEETGCDVVYTDEDKYVENNRRRGRCVQPHFKPDFNIDLLRSCNYITHFFVADAKVVERAGDFHKEYDGSQDYDFILRCTEKAQKIEHIPKILYHWRIHDESTAADPTNKMYCYEAGQHAIESHLERCGVKARVKMHDILGLYRVKYEVSDNPLISIVIPNKDEKDTLEKCIDSILEKSTYNNFEIVIIENNSETREIFEYYKELEKNDKIKIVKYDGIFNYSRINNFGVSHCKGEYIIFLNNDIEIMSEDWIEGLLSNCQREEVGAVGAKLLYPDNTIQHAGVVVCLGGIAGHTFVGQSDEDPGYFGRAIIKQDYSAVTAACLMISRKLFDEISGFEEELQVAFNDVDFCLKVRNAGYLIVFEPDVKLYHYESKTRGNDTTPEKKSRFDYEVSFMLNKWNSIIKNGDPYYNPNLTLVRSNLSIKLPGEESPVEALVKEYE